MKVKGGLLHLKTLVITNNQLYTTSFPPLILLPISPLMSGKSSTFRITLLGFFSARFNLPFVAGIPNNISLLLLLVSMGFKPWCTHILQREVWGFFLDMGGFSYLRKASLPSPGEVWSQEQPWRRWARKELSSWRSSRSFSSWSWWWRLCPGKAPGSTRRSLRF